MEIATQVAIIAAIGSALVPIVGAMASFVARPRSQRELHLIDLTKARLDLLERTIKVGEVVSNHRRIRFDMSSIETEFLRVMVSVQEAAPPLPGEAMEFQKSPVIVRIFRLPRPMSLSGWILTAAFYMLLFYMIIFSTFWSIFSEKSEFIELKIGIIVVTLSVAWLMRWFAIRLAVRQRKFARDSYECQMALVSAARARSGSL